MHIIDLFSLSKNQLQKHERKSDFWQVHGFVDFFFYILNEILSL